MNSQAIEDIYDLSPMQQGMLFHTLYAPESGVYFDQYSIALRGAIDSAAFERAWRQVAERHAVLRTSFYWEGLDHPQQVVHREAALPLTRLDWRAMPRTEQERQLEAFLRTDRARGFDLAQAPLTRLTLIRLADDLHQLVWSNHHLLIDGWSRFLLFKEVFAFYEAFSKNRGLDPGPARRYRDYISWLRQQDLSAAEEFWRETLEGFTAPTPLTVDRPAERAARIEESYGEEELTFACELTASLQAFARRHQLTLNTLVQGAWAILLHRYSGEEDVVFGATVSGRPAALPGVESMVGVFINTLPVRVRIPRGPQQLAPWLKRLQEQQIRARQYEYTPLSNVQEWSAVPGGLPLFESILVFENYPVDGSLKDGGSLRVENVRLVERTNYPLTLLVAQGSELLLKMLYDRRRFDAGTVRRMLGHLRRLLASAVESPSTPLSRLPLLEPDELSLTLRGWNSTAAPPPPRDLVHLLFREQARRTPDANALSFGGTRLSYAELDTRASRLARRLRRLGVGPEVPVALLLERGIEMVVAVLAVLKAGGVYVPLERGLPEQRVSYVLRDTGARVVLTEAGETGAEGWAGGAEVLEVRRAEQEAAEEEGASEVESGVTGQNGAYVLYTSGSTGQPKGVILSHRSLANLLAWQLRRGDAPRPLKTLQFAALSFDVSFQEIFSTWCAGGTLVVAPTETRRDAKALLRLLCDEGVERVFLPFAVLQHLSEVAEENGITPPALREIITAGEQLQITRPVAGWLSKLRNCRLDNQYGPTEAHVVSAHSLTGEVVDWPRLPPIGRPIANALLYVLDRRLEPVPVGVPGELHIGGVALARGYLRRPGLTARKFIPDHLSGENGARLYKTGDLARYLPDGEIEYLGRADHQVKIRGFRVELGEIEATLAGHPSVKECAVVLREDVPGDKRLAAYVVTERDAAVQAGELRGFLNQKLPDYMIPSAFVALDRLPLNRNGKVERRALPAPDAQRAASDTERLKPRTPTEEILAGIWCHVLGLHEVGAEDNFFELGGHSLLATRIVSRLREAFDLEVPVAVLFESPTVAGLALAVESMSRRARAGRAEGGAQPPPMVRVPRDEPLALSFAQQRLWFMDQLRPGNPAYNLAAAVRLTGRLNLPALERSFESVVRRQESLRTFFAETDGQPVQLVVPEAGLGLDAESCEHLPEHEREEEVQRRAVAEALRPFDLGRAPLLRVRLWRLGEREHVLLLVMHHIIGDAWSMDVLVRELATLYESFCRGDSSPLPELPVQYADFAAWQRRWLGGEELERQLNYWRRQLEGAQTVLELPTDWPRPRTPDFRGATQTFLLPEELTEGLKALSRREGATLFMTLLAAYQTLLYRYTRQADIVVGADIANRNREETEAVVGFFVNMLVLRTDLSGNPAFAELLKRVRLACLGAYAHQDVPFDKLVEEFQPERRLGQTPLFQVVFNFDNTSGRSLELHELQLSAMPVDHGLVRFDLSLYMKEEAGGLYGSWKYRADLFEARRIGRLHEQFEVLLRDIVERPQARLNSLELLTPEEREARSRSERESRANSFRKFKAAKPRAIEDSPAALVETLPLVEGVRLPLLIRPAIEDIDLTLWAKNNLEFIESRLLSHGALLFRNFQVSNLSEFRGFADATSRELVDYSEPTSPRLELGEKIYTSTEYPADQRIDLHNEMSYADSWPGKLYFFCVQAADGGGETPVAYSGKVLELLDPKITERFVRKRVMYVRNYGEGVGLSWRHVFRTNDRAEVEAQARKARVELEWKGGDRLRTRQVRDAVATHPATGQPVWFNQAHAFHWSGLDRAVQESLLSMLPEEDLPNNAFYGDGSPIESSVMDEIREVYRQAAVLFPWRKGDLLMLDNMLVAHGREPFAGPRKIVVAMGDSTRPNVS